MTMLQAEYYKILQNDMEKSGLSEKEIVEIYQELSTLVDMITTASEQEKKWIGEDFQKLMKKLKRI